MLFHEQEVPGVQPYLRPTVGLVLLTGPWLAACASPDIRVANDTTYVLSGIEITTPSQTEAFGPLAPGEMSDYVGFGEAYQRAAARFVAGGSLFEIGPVDWGSEEELGAGEYTYHLAIASYGQGMAYLFTTED